MQQSDLPPYTAFAGLTSSDVDMLLPAPHSRMAMRDFINDVYESTGLHRKLTHMDMQALLSQAGFPSESMREHDTISQQQWDEFCAQFRNIVGTLQQVKTHLLAAGWMLHDGGMRLGCRQGVAVPAQCGAPNAACANVRTSSGADADVSDAGGERVEHGGPGGD